MKFTVALPRGEEPGGADAATVLSWEKRIGDLVREGEPLIRLRRGDGSELDFPSPATGIVFRWTIAAGDVIEPGEPVAVLAGVPEPPASPALPPPPRYVPDGPETRHTPTDAQRALARHHRLSTRVAPQQQTVARADLHEVLRLQERAGDAFREREGFALETLPFVVAAAAAALRRFPLLNARWVDDDDIRIQGEVRVALPETVDGALVAPVVRDADRLSVLGLAREIGRLRRAARDGVLRETERRGATFTVTDLGATGVLWQAPILHQPQTGHLGVGAVTDGGIYLCLTHDARPVGSEAAAGFVAAVRQSLETADFLFV